MATLWPNGADLIEWIGTSASADLAALADEIMAEVIDDALVRIPTKALAEAARPGGDKVACPDRLRRALIMEGGRMYARRASRNGLVQSADQIARITAVDPDVRRYMDTLTNWPEA